MKHPFGSKFSTTVIAASLGVTAIGSVALGAVAANAAETKSPSESTKPPISSSVTGAEQGVPATEAPAGGSDEKPNVLYQDDEMAISGAPGVTAGGIGQAEAAESAKYTSHQPEPPHPWRCGGSCATVMPHARHEAQHEARNNAHRRATRRRHDAINTTRKG